MSSLDSPAPSSVAEPPHHISYPRFLGYAVRASFQGGPLFYIWMTLLTAVALVGLHAWGVQVRDGLATTGMSDQVSWGLYIANFTFMVGVAAGAVMMVIPAYLYHHKPMQDVAIFGELLTIAALIVCMAFVVVDLGRPERVWHIIPGLGRFNWPISMLTWDVIVLNVYLLLNLHICGYLLYMRFLGRKPAPKWYYPFVFISIVWAISIHTVTAFLYSGLGGRPFWNTGLLVPRFLASAFVTGPALIVLAMLVVDKLRLMPIGRDPIRVLVNIMRVAVLTNLLLLVAELFTEFYTGGAHAASARYLFFGLHGHTALVPWIWTAIALTVLAALLLLCPKVLEMKGMLIAGCVFSVVGLWIEKGMGLIVPGFVPSTLHEMVEYLPSLIEWQVSAGIGALGLMIYTLALKIAIPILRQG